MKLYVAGPMTGIPAFNFPAFDAAARELRHLGHEVCNPAEHDRETHGDKIEQSTTGDPADLKDAGFSLRAALAYDLTWIAEYAEGVAVLPGWEASKGARAEVALAHALGLVVAPADAWLSAYLATPYDVDRRIMPDTPTGPAAVVDAIASVGGEVRTTSATGGEKGVKPARFGLLPSYPLHLVAEHYAKGAAKYAAHNWRAGYEWSKSFDAMMRHAWAFWDGEDLDPEFGTPHLAAVVFHAFALMQGGRDWPEFDDRFKPAAGVERREATPEDIANARRLIAAVDDGVRIIMHADESPEAIAQCVMARTRGGVA